MKVIYQKDTLWKYSYLYVHFKKQYCVCACVNRKEWATFIQLTFLFKFVGYFNIQCLFDISVSKTINSNLIVNMCVFNRYV